MPKVTPRDRPESASRGLLCNATWLSWSDKNADNNKRYMTIWIG